MEITTIKQIYDLRHQLKSNKQIAEITGTNLATVKYWIKRYNKEHLGQKLPVHKAGRKKIDISNI